MSHTGVVMKLSNNNVNSSEQDCVDITHVNHSAVLVLCVDSSEDEGDSLDFEMVSGPDASCTVREFQGGESVGMHSKSGKKFSDFEKSTCQCVGRKVHSTKHPTIWLYSHLWVAKPCI